MLLMGQTDVCSDTGTYMYIRILTIVITDGSPLEFILLNDLLSGECMYVDVCV